MPSSQASSHRIPRITLITSLLGATLLIPPAQAAETRVKPLRERPDSMITVLGVELPFIDDATPEDLEMQDVPETLAERWRIGPDTTAAKYFTKADYLIAQRVTLIALAGTITDENAVVCVSLREPEASPAANAQVIADLTTPYRKAVLPDACPAESPSLTQHASNKSGPSDATTLGAPKAYRLAIKQTQPWTRSVIFIQADLGQGNTGKQFRCGVVREGGHWHADCLSKRELVF